jgi:hypothetical protein
MPKLDANIYGLDENTFAQKVASESLAGRPNSGDEDYWGGTFDQGSRSKGNAPDAENPDAKGKTVGQGSDSRGKSKGN